MPNYSIIGDVTRSNFDPSEFTALESHGKAMTDQYNAMMTAYGEMQSKASMYEKLANDVKGKDSVAYQNYMNYANALRQHTDLLATQGLTPSTLRNLVQAQSDYQRIIHPIEEAYTARERLAKEQADYLKEHPSAVFERDASNIGIDQMMRLGPSYRAKSVDKEKVAERAKERFSALKNQLMDIVSQAGKDGLDLKDSRQVRTWVKTKAPWLWETMEKYGANPEDVNRLLAGDPSMEDSMLNRIVQDTYRMYGVDSWNTDYDHYSAEQNAQNRLNKMDELYTSIRGEAPNAIGTTKFSDYKNDLDAQILMNRERIAAQERMAQAERDFKAQQAAGEAAKYARMIMGSTYYNDKEDRADEIRNATRIQIYKGIDKSKYGNISWDDLNDIIDNVNKKYNLTYQAGADNAAFYTALNTELENNKTNRIQEITNKIDKAKKYIENLKKKPNQQVYGSRVAITINGKTFTNSVQADIYQREQEIKKLEDQLKNNGYNSSEFLGKDDNSANAYYENYKKETAKKNGWTLVKGKDGNPDYYTRNGQRMTDDYFDRVLDFQSKVHELDEGVTVMDSGASKDMATVIGATQIGSMHLAGFDGFGLSQHEGTTLKKWGFGQDQGEFNKLLEESKKGDKYMRIAPVWNPDLKKYIMNIAFYKNAGDSKPVDRFAVAPRAFGVIGEANGEYVDYMDMYLKNMSDARKTYLNEEATPEERTSALQEFEYNKLGLFGALNTRRTEYARSEAYGDRNAVENRELTTAEKLARQIFG